MIILFLNEMELILPALPFIISQCINILTY